MRRCWRSRMSYARSVASTSGLSHFGPSQRSVDELGGDVAHREISLTRF